MSYTVVIPARYASTRLPGKSLLDIAGKTMLQRVWERTKNSSASSVIIATDDTRIFAEAEAFGAKVVMTREDHPSGTDRLAEVATQERMDTGHIVVNVQGDEPMIPASVIDQVAENLSKHTAASMATLCEPIRTVATLRDPSAAKVVFDQEGYASYFSRSCIPFPRDHDWSRTEFPLGNWYRHIGIYAYRAGFLQQFCTWAPAPAEQSESLEQLRALHYGHRIHVAEAHETVPPGVDTAEDLDQVRKLVSDTAGT
ncbi:MAG: 3-deoxy-manno-octulosonate cytidylyltransferase [Pseudomonadota bacterium]